eukprot:scaffold2618_cov240-Pinguiococcus_pyrenoidosus.AAC.12
MAWFSRPFSRSFGSSAALGAGRGAKMYIKTVIIDGFKSYARRTVVSGFDPKFNAITGLNGSGKSNILDAICFVLGITDLGQVRVRKLQELVYKQGQAGVTKATVSIVFDNRDKGASPLGYETCDEITITRQLVIGGRNKYLINGTVVPAKNVQNLFHSVQLNVNNPHFLIMQGRITKVLNMKPPEILGMIEEAAGTRMYELKKKRAIETMGKKQSKVDEINRILREDIKPQLEKLHGEKEHYLQWSNNKTEIERLKKFCIAHEYVRAQEMLENGEQEREEMRKKEHELEQQIASAERAIKVGSRRLVEGPQHRSCRDGEGIRHADRSNALQLRS